MEFLIYAPNLLWPWISKIFIKHKIDFLEVGIQLLVVALIIFTTLQVAKWSGLRDVEIWNGFVTEKKKVKVSCEHSYSCNCRESCSGSGEDESCYTTCDTCYDHSHDYDWRVYTTIGAWEIQRLDKQGVKEPPRWSLVAKDDPVSAPRQYTNYILGAPHSLFNLDAEISPDLAGIIPDYPSKVYDYYQVDRVLVHGVPINAKEWSKELQKRLSRIGQIKEVNVVLVFTNYKDATYAEAIRTKWMGGKKNDVIVVIGSDSQKKINWVSVISWTDAELFKVKLRDSILELGTIDRGKFFGVLTQEIVSGFSRKSMGDFEYLEKEMKPSTTALIVSFIIALLVNAGLTFVFYRTTLIADIKKEFGSHSWSI